jgi:hypothetical protein
MLYGMAYGAGWFLCHRLNAEVAILASLSGKALNPVSWFSLKSRSEPGSAAIGKRAQTYKTP